MSSPDENKKIVLAYLDVVINGKKLDKMGDYFASDYNWYHMDGTVVRSSQDSSHTSMLRWLLTAVPDIHYAVEHAVAEGDMVAVSTTATGTAKTEMFGLPAGQKKVRFKQMFFFKLANGKMTDEWEVVDRAGLDADLGKK